MKLDDNIATILCVCGMLFLISTVSSLRSCTEDQNTQQTLEKISKDKVAVANIKKEMVFAASGLEQRLTFNGQVVWVSSGAKPLSNVVIPELDTDIKVETSPAVK